MQLEPIHLRAADDADRAAVQDEVVAAVEANPGRFFARYDSHPASFGGRFVTADLFKETFDPYRASRESRVRYCGPLHNASAVLASAQFRRMIGGRDEPARRVALFVTGIPGGGKTSAVLAAGGPQPCHKVIYEGQLARPATALPKIEQALSAGLSVAVLVVHRCPEDALHNTLRRFLRFGRGSCIDAMAAIQGELPLSLAAVRNVHGDRVRLGILDARNRRAPVLLQGWDHLDILRSEGGHADIARRLRAELERLHDCGALGDEAWQQANGLAAVQAAA